LGSLFWVDLLLFIGLILQFSEESFVLLEMLVVEDELKPLFLNSFQFVEVLFNFIENADLGETPAFLRFLIVNKLLKLQETEGVNMRS